MSKVAEQVGVIDIFRAIIMFCVNATVNIFWVLLFVLYLLYEQNKDSLVNARSTVSSSGGVVRQTSTLRQDIDNQIQRYLVLKTLISACVGGGVGQPTVGSCQPGGVRGVRLGPRRIGLRPGLTRCKLRDEAQRLHVVAPHQQVHLGSEGRRNQERARVCLFLH